MYVQQFFVEGLGHASYLIGSSESNEGAVIDPRRDVEEYLAAAQAAGLRLRFVLETHVHNDFLSGARALAAATGAEHVAAAEAGLKFEHRGVRDGDVLELGELKICVLFTPGHTPEHVTYAVADTARADVPVVAFTGGDLLVGSVGRPDLLGKELGEKLAPLLFESLHEKILKLEDYVEVLPTHGAGSLCGKNIGGKRTSTIGYERRFNPALQIADKGEFVRFVLADNPGIPAYYRRMRPANQQGVGPWVALPPRPLPADDVRHLAGHGAIVLDARDAAAFGGGHVPGAINIGLSPVLPTWAGWLLSDDVPLILVLDQPEQWGPATASLARIGYERIAGYLQGGMASWHSRALPLEHVPQWTVHELRERLGDGQRRVLDVRSAAEWEAGHIAGAVHAPLGDLPAQLETLARDQPWAVICGSGYRSSIGTSLLQRAGFGDIVNVLGGMTAWQAADYPVAVGQASGKGHAAKPEEKPAAGRVARGGHPPHHDPQPVPEQRSDRGADLNA